MAVYASRATSAVAELLVLFSTYTVLLLSSMAVLSNEIQYSGGSMDRIIEL